MIARRLLCLALVLVLAAIPLALVARALAEGGWTMAEAAILALAALIAPWVANLGASALIGFVVLMRRQDPLRTVWPEVVFDERIAIAIDTALVLCIRNEDTAAVLARQHSLLKELAAEGLAERFALVVLSDTQDATHAEEEERAVASFRASLPEGLRLLYRRRAHNEGFKAGNVMEFVRHRAAGFEAMVVLDADSVMTARCVLRLVRLMQANPRVALIQTLIVARPALSPFPRLFQFGMRHGMRAYAAGIAWWQGPDGPYWGHNAIIRLAPFRDHAALPTLPSGARILSHDQVEAALLRGAGWEVRLDPLEQGSYEANPPTLLDFLARDLRWMAGNLQYFALLRLPLFRPMGRVQLVLAILLFLFAPIVCAIAALALINAHDPAAAVSAPAGIGATVLFGVLFFAPKLLGALEVALKPAALRAWGGGMRFALSVAVEFVFYLLLLPISAINQTAAMVAMVFGKRIGWAPQARDDRSVQLTDAARALWWHSAIGLAALLGFASASLGAFLWALPLIAGALLAVPFCVATADGRLGRLLARRGICAIPEEFDPASPFPSLVQPKSGRALRAA